MARERLWRSLGSLEPFALSQGASSSLASGPKWPALRQHFRVVHRSNGNVLIASDGLSDPFDDIQEGARARAHTHRLPSGRPLPQAQAPAPARTAGSPMARTAAR